MSRGGAGTGTHQIVPLTHPDVEKLEDVLRHVKTMSTNKNEKKLIGDLLFKLRRIEWRGDEQYPKQVSLKPSELRLIGSIRDTCDVKLDYLSNWHIPQEGSF